MKLCGRWLTWLTVACVLYRGVQAQEKPKDPIATITTGWTYLWADQGANYRLNLNGWFIRPAVTIGRGYSGFANFTNYYGVNSKGSVNSHGITFGVSRYILPHPKVKPSIFAEVAMCGHQAPARSLTNSPLRQEQAFPFRWRNGSRLQSLRRSTSSGIRRETGEMISTPRWA